MGMYMCVCAHMSMCSNTDWERNINQDQINQKIFRDWNNYLYDNKNKN